MNKDDFGYDVPPVVPIGFALAELNRLLQANYELQQFYIDQVRMSVSLLNQLAGPMIGDGDD